MGHLAERIGSLGARVAAIAVTATFSQMAFAAELRVDFPMLSDWSGSVCRSYAVQYRRWKGHAGLAKRSVFVVDSSRRIRYRWVTEDALTEPNLANAMAVLVELTASSSSEPGS